METGRKLYGDKFDDTLKDVFIIGDRLGTKKRTLYHLINGEWTESGILESGLHSVKKVEELFKKGKIKIGVVNPSWKKGDSTPRFIDSNYNDLYDSNGNIMDLTNKEIKIKAINDTRKWNSRGIKKKSLFSKDWTDEDIAEAIIEGNRLLKTGNNGKLAMNLDEATFIEYCVEGGVYNPGDKGVYDKLLNKFQNGGSIELGNFGEEFSRNVYNYNGENINIGSKYVHGVLDTEIKTIFPKK